MELSLLSYEKTQSSIRCVGRLYIPPRQPLNVWMARGEGESITRMMNRTGQGQGGLRRGATLPKERRPLGRWSRKIQWHLPWARWVRAPGYFSARYPQHQHQACEKDEVTTEAQAFSHSVQATQGDHGAKPGGASSRAFSAGHFHP